MQLQVFYYFKLSERRKAIEEKQKLIEEGRKLDIIIQKEIEEERTEKLRQKFIIKQQLDDSFRLKQQQKEYDRRLDVLSKKEQYLLMQEKARKKVEKEKLYRKHFEDYDKLMAERVRLQLAAVSSIESTKSHKLNNWIQKNMAEYQEKMREKEEWVEEWRRNNSFNTRKILRAQIDQKELEREQLRKLRQLSMEDNKRVSDINNELNIPIKKEKIGQQ
jgi:hypothetical protein